MTEMNIKLVNYKVRVVCVLSRTNRDTECNILLCFVFHSLTRYSWSLSVSLSDSFLMSTLLPMSTECCGRFSFEVSILLQFTHLQPGPHCCPLFKHEGERRAHQLE